MNHKRIIYCQGLDGHHLNTDLACNCTLCYALNYYCPLLIYKILIFLYKTMDLIMFISIKVIFKGP